MISWRQQFFTAFSSLLDTMMLQSVLPRMEAGRSIRRFEVTPGRRIMRALRTAPA